MKRTMVLICLVLLFVGLGPARAEDYQLPEVSVSATRSEQKMEKLPRNVTVITREDIERISPLTLVDLFKSVPGVIVRDYTGTGVTATVDLRGFGESAATHTLVTVDGRRMNEIDLSGADWSTIPVESIERIEILHGPAGVLYGDNAVGGVINIITREGAVGHHGRVEARAGSWGLYGARANLSGGGEKYSYSLAGRYDHTDGYRDNSATDLKNVSFSTRIYATDVLSFLIDGGLNKADYDLPGALTQAQVDENRRQSVRPDDWARNTDGHIRGQIRYDAADWGVVTTDLSYRGRQAESQLYEASESDINTFGLQPKWVVGGKLGGFGLTSTVGLDVYYIDMNSRHASIGEPTSQENDFTVGRYGLYALEEIELVPSLVLSLGGRYQAADYEIELRPVGSASSGRNYNDNQWAANLGLAWSFSPGSKIYGRVARTFRYPTVDEYVTWGSFTNLEPEKVINFEVGGEYRFLDTGRFSLAGYLMLMDDEIAYDPATYTNENLDDTRHLGLEAVLRIPLGGPRVHLLANFTYMQAKFTSGPWDGNSLPLVPEWKAGAGLTGRIIDRLNGSIMVNAVGSRYNGDDKANEYDKLPRYATVDLHLDYRWGRLTLFFNVDNLFNAEYSTYGYVGSWGSSFYPAPERTFYGGVSVGW